MMNPRWKDEAWYAEKKQLYKKDTAINNGIMAQQDESDDNAHADTRNRDNTPETVQRNGNSEAETTSAMETEKQCHGGKCPTSKRKGSNKGNRAR